MMSITAFTYLKKHVPRNIRNWVKSPRHTSRWIWDETRHFLGVNPSLLIRPSWPLICHPAAYRFARHEQMDDPDQRKEFDAFISSAIPGMVLFDIGAHFGIFSLAALHHGGPAARAIAVDPSPSATQMIGTQARLNQITQGKLEIVQAMVGESVGAGEMVSVGVIAGGYFVPPSASHTAADRSQTEMTTVDELARRYGVVPTHLKIDVEGAEAAVLRGARQTLTNHSPVLFLELHHEMLRRNGGDPRVTLGVLDKLGYYLSDTSGQRVSSEAVLAHELVRVIGRKSAPAPQTGF